MTKVVLGGGIGGLTAAYYLKQCISSHISIIEGTPRLGGWIKSTVQSDGTIFEQGPRTIRPRGEAGANTLELIDELGLSQRIISIPMNHPAALNRMVYANGALHKLPSNFASLFKKQQPFTKPLALQFANDLIEKRKIAKNCDETIYDFTNRRFGNEIADYLISPLICGICAGNAKEISAKFLLKNFFEYEQKHGSISKGLMYNLFTPKMKSPTSKSALVNKAKTEKWSVYSFQDGIETLTQTLACNLEDSNVEINLATSCTQIDFIDNDRIDVFLSNGQKIESNCLISSLPAKDLAKLFAKQHPKLSSYLNQIPYVTVGVVNLQYEGNLIAEPGFGFLIAPKDNLPILGVIYDSCCFSMNKNTSLTVMMGGYWFNNHFGPNPSPNQLLNVAIKQIQNILKISDEPVNCKVSILNNCIPQYIVGHEKLVEDINDYIKSNNLQLFLCGSSYYGVGINDVIMTSKKIADNVMKIY